MVTQRHDARIVENASGEHQGRFPANCEHFYAHLDEQNFPANTSRIVWPDGNDRVATEPHWLASGTNALHVAAFVTTHWSVVPTAGRFAMEELKPVLSETKGEDKYPRPNQIPELL